MSDKHIILDPTGLYNIPPAYIAITTEVEWIKFLGVSNARCWVRGERLCQWAELWLQSWNRLEEIREIKQHPRDKLVRLFTPLPLPHDWSDQQLLILVTELDAYPQDDPIAYFLTDKVTESDGQQIWLAEPSVLHLAAWLAIPVPEEYQLLESVWQQRFQEHELASFYQTEDKLLLLRQWLGIAEPVFDDLGKYPLPVPQVLSKEFDHYWEEIIYRTEGKVMDTLNPPQQVGMERIANCVYKLSLQRPNWINQVRESRVMPYLNHQQRQELSLNQPPPQPPPLALDAAPEQALIWVTKDYLPFRRWEVIKQSSSAPKISNQVADSFVLWILAHYPQMQSESVKNSYLNYSVASQVQNLCQGNPVLWVVVDGLGWLDHLELLSLLTNDGQLSIETAITPRFSILPTKTEYAKWSLYAQLLPSDSAWVANAGQAFVKIGMGKRYTDEQDEKLYKALRKKTHRLYCWDTQMLDSVYQQQKDWQSFYQLDRPHSLQGIAKRIDYCLQQYPDADALRIVIAGDHGQIMGTGEKITHCPPECQPQGRMAIGKTDDPRFVVLASDRYGLPHDVSVVKGSGILSSLSYKNKKKISNYHGGLFPEEVVVGVSVLRKSSPRLPVRVYCRGEGKPKQAAELEIIIDNFNSVPLTQLYLYIHELPDFQSGKLLKREIPANQRHSFYVRISQVPELPPSHKGNKLLLSGELSFRFSYAEFTTVALVSESHIIVKQIFNSGLDIDDFF